MRKRRQRRSGGEPAGARRAGRPSPTDPAPPRPLWRLLTAEDLRDHPIQVVVIVAVLLATLVAPPVAFGVSTVRRVRATERIEGTVVDVATFRGRRTTRVSYTYEYRVDGVAYRGSCGGSRVGPDLARGATVRVFVDPAAPHRSYLTRRVGTGWLAATSFFWGAASLLVRLRHVPSGRHLLRPRHAWAFALVFTAPVLLVVPLGSPIERWWLVPLVYLATQALTTLWLLVRRRPD